MTDTQANCLYCERDSQQVPLLALTFRGRQLHICPQHLPLLIHDPSQLVGKLAGAENLVPADHQD
ncbi:MAG: hypothetical protein GY856_28765 [bacterium]|nr:hypothetical protein [bacterium]